MRNNGPKILHDIAEEIIRGRREAKQRLIIIQIIETFSTKLSCLPSLMSFEPFCGPGHNSLVHI
jgi:hypothetical protein